MRIHELTHFALAVAATLAGAGLAAAQSSSHSRRSQQDYDRADPERRTQSPDRRDAAADSDYWRDHDDSSWWGSGDWGDWGDWGDVDVDLEVDPNAWVRVAYDYDDDGTYDTYGYVYALDLKELLSSGARSLEEWSGNAAPRGPAGVQRHSQGYYQNRRTGKTYRFSGELTQLYTLTPPGMRQEHIVGRVETDRADRIRVDLGPKEEVRRQLDLLAGDRLTVIGRKGQYHGEPILIASEVQSGGNTLRLQRSRTPQMEQGTGTIISTRTMSVRGDDERHIVATVRSDSGVRRQVALGSESTLQDIGVGTGDRIQFVARPCRINGDRGLVASEIHFDGRTYSVNDRTRSRSEAGATG